MPFVVSVDGQVIPTNGINALVEIGIPPEVGSVNTDFSTGVGTNGAVNQIKKLGDGYVVTGEFSSYNKSGGYSPAQFRGIAPLSLEGSPLNSYSNGGIAFNAASGTRLYKLSTGKYIGYGRFISYNDNIQTRIVILDSNFGYDPLNANMGAGITPTGIISNTPVNQIIEQPDGKIIVVGNFTAFNGTTQNRITRLNADFTLDTTFATNIGAGANNAINTVGLQSDGKIIIGGTFTSFNGTTRNRITRLNADGTHDTTFTQGTGMSSTVNGIYVLPDNKIAIVGQFASYAGTTRQKILVLNSDGTIDASFDTASGLDNNALSIAFFDNKLYVTGVFNNYKGVAASKIVSINLDATINSTFVGSFTTNILDFMIIDCDSLGNIYVGGTANVYNTVTTNGIVKISPTGTLLSTFGTGFNDRVSGLKIFGNELLLSGRFTTFQGNKSVNGNFYDRMIYLDKNGSPIAGVPKGLSFTATPLIDTYNNELVTTATTYNGINYNKPIKILSDGNIGTFNAPTGTHSIIKYNSNGKVYIVGSTIPGNIQRYNNDGSTDVTFTGLGFDGTYGGDVYELSDGRVCVCTGGLTTYNGIAVNNFLILNNDGTFNSSYVLPSFDGTKIDCIVQGNDIYVAYLNTGNLVTIQKIGGGSVSILGNLGNIILKGNRIYLATNFFDVDNLSYFIVEYDLDLNKVGQYGTMPFDGLFNPTGNYICKDGNIGVVGGSRNTFSGSTSKNIIAINI